MSISLVVPEAGPVILIDGSYFVIHRFFATLKWYKFRNPEVDANTCMMLEDFKTAILKHAQDTLIKMKKKWAMAATGKKRLAKQDWENIPVWFALDSSRADIWRSQITENYKGTRDTGRLAALTRSESGDALDVNCFELLHTLLLKEMPLLRARALEADDIIAIIHTKLRTQGYQGLIICITNDNDYLQLRDENTRLHNLSDKDIGQRSCGDPKKDLLYKVLLGDKSDNIPAVSSRIKEKKLKEICHLTEDEIVSSLCLTEEEKTRMILNRTLVDFTCIPKDLVDECLTMYTITVTKN